MNDQLPVIALVVLAGAILVSLQTRVASLQRRLDRLARIDGKLDVLLKHAGLRFDPLESLPPEVVAALRQGQKIEAIKQYRHATGAGLAEAKDVVEEAQRRGRMQS